MLKAFSSTTNAIGALNYKGTWNASTNSPALASGVGTKGDYYVVSVAGATSLDGISNWGVGDLATYNGSIWQRVEGGADLNGVNLSVSGTTTLSGLTVSTALALNASKEVVSVTNTGTGNNVLATTPTFTGDVSLSTGNIVVSTAGKGFDFSVNPSAGGMTSELLDDYEEGTWTPVVSGSITAGTYQIGTNGSTYTKVGRLVTLQCFIQFAAVVTGGGVGNLKITGLPFSKSANTYPVGSVYLAVGAYIGNHPTVVFNSFSTSADLSLQQDASGGYGTAVSITFASGGAYLSFTLTYEEA